MYEKAKPTKPKVKNTMNPTLAEHFPLVPRRAPRPPTQDCQTSPISDNAYPVIAAAFLKLQPLAHQRLPDASGSSFGTVNSQFCHSYISLLLVFFEEKMLNPKLQVLLVILCLVTTLSSSLFIVLLTAKAEPLQGSVSLIYEVDSAFSVQLTQTIQLENPTSLSILGGELFVPLIVNDTLHHYVILFNITSSLGEPITVDDSTGNVYAYWDNLMIAPGQRFTAKIDYYVLSFAIRYSLDAQLITDYDRHSDFYQTYTQPEQLVQSEAPEIVAEAQKIIQGAQGIHDMAFRIYSFVTSHVHYTSETEERGALWALVNGTGDCSEYSYLFVALCRAVGIPARVNVGFGFQGSQESVVEGHMWAEYYLQGYGWVPVDPTWNVFDAMDEKHFATMKGASEDIPCTNYFFNFSSGPDSAEVMDSQLVTLLDSPNSFRGDELAEDTLAAVKTVNEARSAVATSRFLGVPVFFGSESALVDQDFAASELSLQGALENWQTQPQTAWAQILEAQSRGEEALRGAWMLVSYVFAMFIGALMAIIMVAYLLVRRWSNKVAKASFNLGNQGSS